MTRNEVLRSVFRDLKSLSLEDRIREYLARFPHRDEDMSKYGVCREWLAAVIQAETDNK